MRLPRRALAGLAAGLLAGRPARAQPDAVARLLPAGRLRAGVSFDGSALAFEALDGRPDGLAVAVAELLAHGLGVSLELVPTQGNGGQVQELLDGRFDLLVTGPAVNVVTARAVMFTDPFAAAELMLVAPRHEPVASLADVAGLRVVALGGPMLALLQDRPLRGLGAVLPVAGPTEAARCIRRDSCDAALLPDFVARQVLALDAELEPKLLFGPYWLAGCLPYGQHDLLRAINTVLYLADGEGILARLHQGFLNRPLPPRPLF
jgi:ABC-type amino acid transport substrate-binding protein